MSVITQGPVPLPSSHRFTIFQRRFLEGTWHLFSQQRLGCCEWSEWAFLHFGPLHFTLPKLLSILTKDIPDEYVSLQLLGDQFLPSPGLSVPWKESLPWALRSGCLFAFPEAVRTLAWSSKICIVTNCDSSPRRTLTESRIPSPSPLQRPHRSVLWKKQILQKKVVEVRMVHLLHGQRLAHKEIYSLRPFQMQ